MFRSLHMKLVLIMLLLITSLMTVVGAFLMTSITDFYVDAFYQQMESVFLNQMLAQMRKCSMAGEEGGLFGSKDQEMFQGMLDQERAKAWSQSGGVGLASILFEQMKGQQM